MTDEFDVEALLEAPYKRELNGERSNWEQYDKFEPNESTSNIKNKKRHAKSSEENDREISKNGHKSKEKYQHKSERKSKSPRHSHSRDRSKSHNHKSRHRSCNDSKSEQDDDGSRHRSKSDRHRSKSDRRSKSKEKSDSKSTDPKEKSRSSSRDKKRRKRSLTPISLPGRKPAPFVPPPFPRYKKFSPPHGFHQPPPDDLSLEERDARTIFCMQLSQRIRAKDLEEFFSSVGKVRDVRLITCNKTRRFKGIAYIEFKDPESVTLALGLNGQKLLGIPIIVQPTQAEKNRIGNTMPNMITRSHPGPTRLYVGSLHFNITEDMLRGIFEPFGKIDSIQLMTDLDTGRSKGYGFVTYHSSDDAKKALDQMNGFELAGRPMKVNNVTEKHDYIPQGSSSFDTDELDRAGIDLGATGRLQLMYKLAEGTGMEIPAAAASALNLNQSIQSGLSLTTPAPPIVTQCFMLANMFDPTTESQPNWDIEIQNDVIEECSKHGGCVHVYVDKESVQGNVYVKCPSITTAGATVNSLHGRWFGGRIITAAYVPVLNYHNLFPETIVASTLLTQNRNYT